MIGSRLIWIASNGSINIKIQFMKLSSNTLTYWLTLLYILPYVLYRSRYPLPEFGFYSITLPIEIFAIFSIFFLNIFLKNNNLHVDRDKAICLFATAIIFSFLLIHSLGMSAIYGDGNTYQQFVNLSRMGVYLFATIIFALFYFEFKIFKNILFNLCLFLILFTLFLRVLNPGWLSDSGYGFYRPAALLSEPSAFAPIVTMVFFVSIIRRNLVGAISSASLIYLLSSGIVFLVFTCTAAMFLFLQRAKTLLVIFLLSFPILLIQLPAISSFAENSYLFERLASAITNTSLVEQQGGTARLTTLINLYGELANDERLYFGRGLNSAKAFFGDQWEYREFSLLHLYSFSFGVVGVTILMALISIATFRAYRTKNMEFLMVFFPFLASSLINSAQGTVLHKFAYLFVLIALLKPSQMKVERKFQVTSNEQGRLATP